MGRRGVFPGTFDPLTVAHLAIAHAAREQRDLDSIDLAISRVALKKESVGRVEERARELERVARDLPWLGVVVTEHQLLADIAEGYDVLVLGADKWAQIQDPEFYGGSPAERDAAVTRLPEVAVAPRKGFRAPRRKRLDVPRRYAVVSSTAVRSGREIWRASF